MKPAWIVVTTVFVFTSCKDNNNPSQVIADVAGSASAVVSDKGKEEKNKQTAIECIKSWNTGDIDNIVKHLAVNTVDYGDGSTPPARGIDTARMFMELWRSSVNEYRSENEIAVADGDYVFIYADWRGSFKSDFMGMKTAGKKFNFKDVDIFKFDNDGKVTEHRAVLFSTMLREIAASGSK